MATPLSGLPILGAPVWTRSIDLQTAEPLQPVQVFADSDRVLGVSFPIVQIPAGTEIQAAWEYNDTSLDGLDVSLAVEIDRVEGWVAFRLERDDGGLWPDGRYMILLETDGVAITSGEIEVVEES